MIPEELRVFVGALIYMGIHKEPQIKDYWNTNIHLGPLHTIASHISLRRFEQIKRFLHISDAEEDIRQGRDSSPEWWHKLEPLASALQHSFMRLYAPSSTVSVDELMVRCCGRSKHTYKMPSKPIPQGYKIYGIAGHVKR
jgi:Transposase IS4